MENSNQKRVSWTSKFGFLMATAGSAVGLGNLWRFPFMTANGGGGVFLILYLTLVFTIGLGLLLLEMGLGAKMRLNPVGAMRKINSHFGFIGSIGIWVVTIIFPFYSIVGGWIFHYFLIFCTQPLIKIHQDYFSQFIQNPYWPLFYTLLFMILTAFIVIKGVKNGIEKYSKIMMPALFMLLLCLVVRSATLPNAFEGIKFFLWPDFSKVTTNTFLTALGQVFFSLSIGMGTFITYASYLNEKVNLPKTAMIIVSLDTLVAFLAGLMIFPTVFSFNVPLNSGPTLVFITLPKIFSAIPFGSCIGILFFILLSLAALTSSISILEVAVAYLNDNHHFSRKKSVILFSVFCFFLAIPMSLSFGLLSGFKIFDKSFFDLADFIASNILLPLGGILLCISVGWFYGFKNLEIFQNKAGNIFFGFLIKFIAPIAICIILLQAVGLI